MKDERIFDKICCWIESVDKSYVYKRENFRLEQTDDGVIITDWNLDIKKPAMNIIMSIDVSNYKKPVIKNSLEDIIRRLELLELKNGLSTK